MSNFIKIKTKDITKTGGIIEKIINVGANNVQDVNYLLEDQNKHKKQVLNKALDGISEKIEDIIKYYKKSKIENIELSINSSKSQPFQSSYNAMHKSEHSLSTGLVEIKEKKVLITTNLTGTYKIK
ncbi:MAG: SIMPL domain-containing protein [archaeon]